MKEIFMQIRNSCPICNQGFGLFYLPFGDDDREKSKEFKLFQIVRNQIYGFKKERSLKQLNTYWRACQIVADNNESPGWQTKEQVDFNLRISLHFYDPDLIVAKPDGSIAFSYRSIAFKNLAHCEACGYFSAAFEIMAEKLGITIEKLIKNINP